MSINTNINTIYPATENVIPVSEMLPTERVAHMHKIMLTLTIEARPAAEVAERALSIAAAEIPTHLNEKRTLEQELKNIAISIKRNLNLIDFFTPSSQSNPTVADLARVALLNEENSQLAEARNILIGKIFEIDRKLSEITEKERDRNELALRVQSLESQLAYVTNIVYSRN